MVLLVFAIKLTNPMTVFALLGVGGIVGNFVFVSRIAAVRLSLGRGGVSGDAQITKKRKLGGGRGGSSFWVTYEFVDFSTNKKYRHIEFVSFSLYSQWNIGDTVRTVVLPHNPRISRLADSNLNPVLLSRPSLCL